MLDRGEAKEVRRECEQDPLQLDYTRLSLFFQSLVTGQRSQREMGMPYLATGRSVAGVKKEEEDSGSWYRIVVSLEMCLLSWVSREESVPRLCVG